MTEVDGFSGLPNDMIICILELLDDLVDCICFARTCRKIMIIWAKTLPKIVQINQAIFDGLPLIFYTIKIKNYGLNMSPDICYTRSFNTPIDVKRNVTLTYDPSNWKYIDYSLATTKCRKFQLIEFSDRWEFSYESGPQFDIIRGKKPHQPIGKNLYFSVYYTFIIHAQIPEEFKQKYWEAFNGPTARTQKPSSLLCSSGPSA